MLNAAPGAGQRITFFGHIWIMLRIIFVLTTTKRRQPFEKEADYKQQNQGAMDDTLAVCIAVRALRADEWARISGGASYTA